MHGDGGIDEYTTCQLSGSIEYDISNQGVSFSSRDAIQLLYTYSNTHTSHTSSILTTVSIWRVAHSGHQCVAFCLKVNPYHSAIHQSSVQVTYNGIELQYICTLCYGK